MLSANLTADRDAWVRLLAVRDHADLVDAEPGTRRFRLCRLRARIAKHARRLLRIEATWPWANAFTTCGRRLSELPAVTRPSVLSRRRPERGDPHHPGPVEPGAAAASRDGPPPTAGDIASEPPSRSAPEPRCRIEVKGESRRAADIQVWYRDDRGWQFACGELADSLDGQFAQPPLVEEGAALVGRRQTGSNGGVVTPPKGKMPRLVSVGRRSPTG